MNELKQGWLKRALDDVRKLMDENPYLKEKVERLRDDPDFRIRPLGNSEVESRRSLKA